MPKTSVPHSAELIGCATERSGDCTTSLVEQPGGRCCATVWQTTHSFVLLMRLHCTSIRKNGAKCRHHRRSVKHNPATSKLGCASGPSEKQKEAAHSSRTLQLQHNTKTTLGPPTSAALGDPGLVLAELSLFVPQKREKCRSPVRWDLRRAPAGE
jgi:hypothetical protein